MNTLEALYSRHSVRTYTGQQLTEEELAEILKAANAAPVGMGKYETLHLTVIQNPDLLKEIDAAAAAFFQQPQLHPLYGAPTLVLVSAKIPPEGMGNIPYSNTATVVQNMALAATELDVGVCHIWGAVFALAGSQDLLKKLSLPEGFAPCCAAALGKTAETYTQRDIHAERIAVTVLK